MYILKQADSDIFCEEEVKNLKYQSTESGCYGSLRKLQSASKKIKLIVLYNSEKIYSGKKIHA